MINMLFKDHFGSIVCSIVMFVLGGTMAIVSSLITGAPITYAGFLQAWGAAFVINYIAALIFPVGEWAHKICCMLKLEPNSLVYQLVSVFVQTAVFITWVTLGMMTINVGFNEMFWPAFFSVYPILFGIGFVVSFFVGMVAAKIAGKIVEA